MKRSSLTYMFAVLSATALLSSCKSNGEFTGREYMPDMAHSIAYEANQNTYYNFNHWGGKEDYDKYVQPRKPVPGTVAFGRSKEEVRSNSPLTYPTYVFTNTDAGRESATAQLLDNPVRPSSQEDLDKTLAKGQELYEIYCGSCHGKEGDGNGKLYNSGNGPYPAAPANFLSEQFIGSTEGRFYHAIMFGKGVMQSHADKLSHDERWMVIHYIRSLQTKKAGGEYNLATALSIKGKKEEPKEEEKKDEKKDDKKGGKDKTK